MSADRDVTRIVRSWLRTEERESADRVLDVVLGRLDTTPQRRPWWRAWRTRFMGGTLKLAAAAIVLLMVVAVALAVYFSQPGLVPASSPAPAKAPWVVFLYRPDGAVATDLWAIRSDGTRARRIFEGLTVPNVAWSSDGTRLIAVQSPAVGSALSSGRVFMAEVADGIGPFVDTGMVTGDGTCRDEPLPCHDSAFDFDPAGQRLAFVQRCTVELPACMFLTILDLRTGERTELDATLNTPPAMPAWSPDGSQIAFTAETDHAVVDELFGRVSALYLINPDGSNLREINFGDLSVAEPRWSPDGSEIAFTGVSWLPDGGQLWDVYKVPNDGGAPLKLTNDGASASPEWITSSEIRFVTGQLPRATFFSVDAANGKIDPYADLTEALASIDPPGSVQLLSLPGGTRTYFWQPDNSAGDD